MSVSTSLRIRLPLATEAEFIERYRAHLARGGIFIATRAAKPEGTELSFELVLRDGVRVLRGAAVVLKVRREGEGAAPGMMLRFRKLDGASKNLVERLAAERSSLSPLPVDGDLPKEVEVELEFTGEAPAPNAAMEWTAPSSIGAEGSNGAAPTHGVSPLSSPNPAESAGKDAGASKPMSSWNGDAARARRRASLELPVAAEARPPAVAVGLEIGAYRIRAAIVREGQVELLALGPDDARYLPAAVALTENNELLYGWDAARARQPWYGWSRGLGLRADAPLAGRALAPGPFPLALGVDGNVAWQLGDRVAGATDLLQGLLEQVHAALITQLGESMRASIALCVPSHFGHRQRAALQHAAEPAGLTILRLVESTSAAVLGMGHGQGLPRKRIFVCCHGDGTTDAAVVELTGNDLESVASLGDPALGALEVDRAVADRLGLDPGQALEALSRVGTSPEAVERGELEVPSPSGPVTLTRAALEEALAPYAKQALILGQTVLEEAGLQPQGLDGIVLAGVAARIPGVPEHWRAALGKAPLPGPEAENLAVCGAALLAHAITHPGSGPAFATISEVLNRGLEVVVEGSGLERVFDRRTHLPAEKTLEVKCEAGKPVRVAVFQRRGEELEYVGLAERRPERSGSAQLRFTLDASGMLALSFLAPKASQAEPMPLEAAAALPGELQPVAAVTVSPPTEGGLFRGLKRLLRRA